MFNSLKNIMPYLKKDAENTDDVFQFKSYTPQQLHTPLNYVNWTERSYQSFAIKGYMSNPVVYRSLRMIAESAARIPFTIKKDNIKLATHPFLDLISAPNCESSSTTFFEQIYLSLYLTGNVFLQALRVYNEIKELHMLNADRMSIITDHKGWIQGYNYHIGKKKEYYPLLEDDGFSSIFHMKFYHPLYDNKGLSPFEAAHRSIDIHNAASQWSKSLLDNSARPSGALIYQGGENGQHLTAKQFERLRQELEESFQGSQNAGRPLLLEGGLSWQSMSFSPKEIDFTEIRNAAARDIALTFGIPPMLLGIPGDNTYANYAEANRSFYQQTVIPLINKFSKQLSMWLRKHYSPNIMLDYDLNAVEWLAKEKGAEWQRIANAHFLTLNEKRELLGFPAMKGGNIMCDRQGNITS